MNKVKSPKGQQEKTIKSIDVIMKKNGTINVDRTMKNCKSRAKSMTIQTVIKGENLDKVYIEHDLGRFPDNVVSFMSEDKQRFKEIYFSRRAVFITKCYTKGMYNQELGDFYKITRFEILEYCNYRNEMIKLIQLFDESFSSPIITKAKLARNLVFNESSERRATIIESHNKCVSTPISSDSYSSLSGVFKTLEEEETAKKIRNKKFRNIRAFNSFVKMEDNFFLNTSEQNFNSEGELNFPYFSKTTAELLFTELCKQYKLWVNNNAAAILEHEKKRKQLKNDKMIADAFIYSMEGMTISQIADKMKLDVSKIKRLRRTKDYKEMVERPKKNDFPVNYNKINEKKEKSEPTEDGIEQAA